MKKMDLGELFSGISGTKEQTKELKSIFGAESVHGDTPPVIPSRIYFSFELDRSLMRGSSTWVPVTDSIQNTFKPMIEDLKKNHPSWKPRGRGVWGFCRIAVSTKSRKVFARIRDTDQHRNRTVCMGFMSYSSYKELIKMYLEH